MIRYILKSSALVYLLFLSISNDVSARERAVVVGSSTLYPFITVSSEIFSYKNRNFKMPVIESNGSGNGIQLFCAGNHIDDPDIAMSSRVMTKEEYKNCNQNNIKPIELLLGYDAIVLVTSKRINISLTKQQLYLAVAKYVPDIHGHPILNPYTRWSEIASSLPDIPIKILGPSSSHGTRDAFIELAVASVCNILIANHTLKVNTQSQTVICNSIRSDDAWSIASDDLNLLIKKISFNDTSIGILSYNFYTQNSDNLNMVKIDDTFPSFGHKNSNLYPLIRPLYLYVKPSHIIAIPSVKNFIYEIFSEDSMGYNGYLQRGGLITLSSKQYNVMLNVISNNIDNNYNNN